MALDNLLNENRILRNLPLLERQLIIPSCELIELQCGDTIDEAGHPIQFLHFPIESAISMTNMQDQEHIVEVIVTRQEGCSGASIVVGENRSPYMAMVQVNGPAIRIAASNVVDRLARLPYFTSALTRYNILVMTLAVISVGCSQFHAPAQRLARWLKSHRQRMDIESFPFSSEFLAAQVGVDSKLLTERLADFENQFS
jgi:hypothetical protein